MEPRAEEGLLWAPLGGSLRGTLGLWTWRRSPTSASRGFPAGTWPFLCICLPARGYGGFAASAGHSQAGRIKKVELGHTEEVSSRGCEVGLEMSSWDVTGQDQSQGRAGPPPQQEWAQQRVPGCLPRQGPRRVTKPCCPGPCPAPRGPGTQTPNVEGACWPRPGQQLWSRVGASPPLLPALAFLLSCFCPSKVGTVSPEGATKRATWVPSVGSPV